MADRRRLVAKVVHQGLSGDATAVQLGRVVGSGGEKFNVYETWLF